MQLQKVNNSKFVRLNLLSAVILLLMAIVALQVGGILSYFTSTSSINNSFSIISQYQVVFHANGGTGTMAEQTIQYVVSTPLNENDFAYTGFDFQYWNTEPDGTGTRYNDKESISLTFMENNQLDLYAQWGIAEATFMEGPTFNAKVKNMILGITNASTTTQDNLVKAVLYSNTIDESLKTEDHKVSAEDSKNPIYMWYENNNLYWWSPDETPSLNKNASQMFRYFRALEDLSGLSNFDVSKCVNFSTFFRNCTSIKNLAAIKDWQISTDLTVSQNGLNFAEFCRDCTALETIDDLKGWSAFNIGNMARFVQNCPGLKSVDFGSWDLSRVQENGGFTDIFTDTPNLRRFRTPQLMRSTAIIPLPIVLYDENGTGYTAVTYNSPTGWSVWLGTGAYDIIFDSNGGEGSMANQNFIINIGGKLTANTFTRATCHFAGWNTEADGSGTSYGDEDFVYDLTYEDTITLYAQWEYNDAKFVSGDVLNVMMKRLASAGTVDRSIINTNPNTASVNTSIKAIKYSSTIAEEYKTDDYRVSVDDPGNLNDIYMWYESGTIYWWSLDTTPYLYDIANYTFRNLQGLKDISDFDKFDTSLTRQANFLFNGCTSITDLSPISNWDTSNFQQMNGAFSNCTKITNVDALSNWNTSKVTIFKWLLDGDTALTNIDGILDWDTSKATNIEEMFRNCASLEEVDLGNFDFSNVTTAGAIFSGETYIARIKTPGKYPTKDGVTIQLPGTYYDDKQKEYTAIDKSMETQIWLDDGSYQIIFDANGGTGSMASMLVKPGDTATLSKNTFVKTGHGFIGWNTEPDGSGQDYATEEDNDTVTDLTTPRGTITLYAQWEKAEAMFDTGVNVNKKMKNIAWKRTNAAANSDDNMIQAIKYSETIPEEYMTEDHLVSIKTDNYKYPIYMWFDEESSTMYWWSLDEEPSLNANSMQMFRNLKALTDMSGLENFDASTATDINNMFVNDSALTNVDALSSWNVSNVTNMQQLFTNCPKLTLVSGIYGWDVSNVTTMAQLFSGDSSISTLDLSNYDLSMKNTNTTSMLTNVTSLMEIKTPRGMGASRSIVLPGTFYDEEGYSYTQITSSTPTQTWLRVRTYEVEFDSNGGLGEMEKQVIRYGTATTLTENAFTREDCRFIGWNTQADGNGQSYGDKESVTNLAEAGESITLYAQWEEASATFDTGEKVIAKMKALSKDGSKGSDTNTAITAILKADSLPDSESNIVSTSDSKVPIYMWFESGKIYWWSLDKTPAVNANAEQMFRGLTKLTDISGLADLDLSSTTKLNYLFRGNASMTNVDALSGWNVSKVTQMNQLFYECSNLTSIDGIKDWNMENVTQMNRFVEADSKLTSIDFGNIELEKLSNVADFFTGCSSLVEIITPKALKIGTSIALPGTFVDENGEYPEIDSIDSTTPKSTRLTKKGASILSLEPENLLQFSNKDLLLESSIGEIGSEDTGENASTQVIKDNSSETEVAEENISSETGTGEVNIS